MSSKNEIVVGSLVVNSSGTFAKVLQIKHGVYVATRWAEDVASLEKDIVGQVRFNESAIKICGIKLASKGAKPSNSTETGAKGADVKTPTPEEQAEIDAMIDYTITEETLEQFNEARAEGMEPFKVGDVVKLAPEHPLLAKEEDADEKKGDDKPKGGLLSKLTGGKK